MELISEFYLFSVLIPSLKL